MPLLRHLDRFRYQPHDSAFGEIHEYIKHLDHEGMQVGYAYVVDILVENSSLMNVCALCCFVCS